MSYPLIVTALAFATVIGVAALSVYLYDRIEMYLGAWGSRRASSIGGRRGVRVAPGPGAPPPPCI